MRYREDQGRTTCLLKWVFDTIREEADMSSLIQKRPEPAHRAAAEFLTFEDFLLQFSDAQMEWVNGKAMPMAPIDDTHGDMADFLVVLLRTWAQDRGLGVVRSEPVLMKTGPDLPGRSPDVLFVARENLARVKRTFIDGPGDLVVEVISIDSVDRDRREKFEEYRIGGVKEYWIIDPLSQRADFHQLINGEYQAIPPRSDGVYQSAAVPGLWLRVEWLWQRPSILNVLREWKLV
jgi:Uma2 family endonuclease